MALTITQSKNVFLLQGVLNASTATNFYNHFKGILNNVHSLKIDINSINEIDNNGLLALYKLYKNAHVYNKTLVIDGKGNQAIYNMLTHYNKVA